MGPLSLVAGIFWIDYERLALNIINYWIKSLVSYTVCFTKVKFQKLIKETQQELLGLKSGCEKVGYYHLFNLVYRIIRYYLYSVYQNVV